MTVSNNQTTIATLRLDENSIIYIGFRYFEINGESYFSVSGEMCENGNKRNDSLVPFSLCEGRFSKNSLLRHICELSAKWHPKRFSKIPKDVIYDISDTMDKITNGKSA